LAKVLEQRVQVGANVEVAFLAQDANKVTISLFSPYVRDCGIGIFVAGDIRKPRLDKVAINKPRICALKLKRIQNHHPNGIGVGQRRVLVGMD